MALEYKNALREALAHIRRHYDGEPENGIILGTGLGGLISEIEVEKTLPYNFIPHFPISTVESHFGKFIFGRIGGKSVVAMQGRFHLYEGYSMREITFPVRLMKLLGVKRLFISNAGGGLNLDYHEGDLVVIDDHINLQTANPLIGFNDADFGPRFPDMSQPYSPALTAAAIEAGRSRGYRIHKGVYVAVTGPNLETRAEYRFLRMIGADVVGMSTVPEVIVATQMGMEVLAISVITDRCDPDNLMPVSVEKIIAVAMEAEPRLTAVLSAVVRG